MPTDAEKALATLRQYHLVAYDLQDDGCRLLDYSSATSFKPLVSYFKDGDGKSTRDLFEAIAELSRSKPGEELGWIPMSKERPRSIMGIGVMVQVYCESDGIRGIRFWNHPHQKWNDLDGCDHSALDMKEITHWMPLPEPPPKE